MAVLAALDEEARSRPEVRLTHVQARANVPFDRLKEYLEELRAKGLVERERWAPTAAGREFVSEFRRFQQLLDRFGFGGG